MKKAFEYGQRAKSILIRRPQRKIDSTEYGNRIAVCAFAGAVCRLSDFFNSLLVVLIRERLGSKGPALQKAERGRERRREAIQLGGQMMARGETPTLRGVGRVLGVEGSTVKRWFPKNDFLAEVEKASHQFDEQGNLRPPPMPPPAPLREK